MINIVCCNLVQRLTSERWVSCKGGNAAYCELVRQWSQGQGFFAGGLEELGNELTMEIDEHGADSRPEMPSAQDEEIKMAATKGGPS